MPPPPTSSGDDQMSQDEPTIRLRNEARRRNGDTTETWPIMCSIAPLKPYQKVRDNSTYKGYLPITRLSPKGYNGSLVERPTASESDRRKTEEAVKSPEDQNSASAEQLPKSQILVPMSMLVSSDSPSSSQGSKTSKDARNERQETQTAYRCSTQSHASEPHFLGNGSKMNKRKRSDSDSDEPNLRGSESSSYNRSSRQPGTSISLDELLYGEGGINHPTSTQVMSSSGLGLQAAAGKGLNMQQHIKGHTEQQPHFSPIHASLSRATKRSRKPTISLQQFPISAMPMLSSSHGYEDQADRRFTPGMQGESREALKDSGSTPSSHADPVAEEANEPISSHRIFSDLQLHYADYHECTPSPPEFVEDEEYGARMLTGAKLMDDVGGYARASRFLC